MSITDDPEHAKDIFRDTPIRLLGYANEVGEAFRAQVHVNVVRLSYAIASAYVVADTIDKSSKTAKQSWPTADIRNRQVTISAVDTLLWQSLASVIIPGFTINRLCFISARILKQTTKFPLITQKWITTALGLACIPFIVKPIDHSVDYLMNETSKLISLLFCDGRSHFTSMVALYVFRNLIIPEIAS